MNTVQPRNLRGASLRSTSLFRSSAWDAHSRRKPRGNGILQSFLASTMVTRVEMDGWWSRVTRGHEMETWSTRVRARGTLVVHWRAETAPNDCRVGDAARRLSSDPHHAACAPPLSLSRFDSRAEGKMGGKVVRCMIGRSLGRYRSKVLFLILFTSRGRRGWVF